MEKEKDGLKIKSENNKIIRSVLLRSLVAIILNFLIYFSVLGVFLNFSTKIIGERIVMQNEDGSVSVIKTIYYSEISPPSVTNPTTSGIEATESGTGTQTTTTKATLPSGQQIEYVRSEPPQPAMTIVEICLQIAMLLVVFGLMYSLMWEHGDKDANRIRFKRIKEDKYRGLKIGAVATIPHAIAYLVLLVSRLSGGVVLPRFLLIYRILNFTFAPIINMSGAYASQDTATVGVVGMIVLFLMLSVYALFAHVGYTFGLKRIMISEKIIYKKHENKKK